MTKNRRITAALLSVSDKTDIITFAQTLIALDIQLLSTGGTATALREQGIKVTDVADYTQFPEMMGGRVKTLHPKIFAGILHRGVKDDALLAQMKMLAIDLVVVNLYPFMQTIANPEHSVTNALENIDIGGPSLIRAAAKNHVNVSVITDPKDYTWISAELRNNQATLDLPTRAKLAAKAFQYTAAYDATIATYFTQHFTQAEALGPDAAANNLPQQFALNLQQKQRLRYGENPQQAAALYVDPTTPSNGIANAKHIQGKALSYNNILDADSAYQSVGAFAQPACVITKHANPCGVAIADASLAAYQHALACDPSSAFGGIIAFNRALDGATAQCIIEAQFVEVIIAPTITPEAKEVLATKPNVRLLEVPLPKNNLPDSLAIQCINGGYLIQEPDRALLQTDQLRQVSVRAPTSAEKRDLLFAWKVVKQVKSNAIVIAKQEHTLGIGAGQMSRVDSVQIALQKAHQHATLDLEGAVMASDAFFPFADSLKYASEAGISAIIQPGGSIRDKDVIQQADTVDMAMLFTGVRHFRH